MQRQTCIEGRHCEKTGGDSHLQAKQRDLEQNVPSQPSEGPTPAHFSTMNFQPPDCGNAYCLSPRACGGL